LGIQNEEGKMRVYTFDKKLITLKHFRFSHTHFLILAQMQADQTLCNCLLETESAEPSKCTFVVCHALDLEDFHSISRLNLPDS
jgi:hypothetical protein